MAFPVSAQDIPGNATTTATIAKDTAKTSRINFAGDKDWFKITLKNANAYQVVSNSTVAAVEIRDAAGNLRIDSGTAQSLIWRTPVSGTFYIVAKGVARRTGSYTVRVSVFDTSANKATEGRLIVGKPTLGSLNGAGSIDGSPSQEDIDWLRVKMTPGRYRLTVTWTGDEFIETFIKSPAICEATSYSDNVFIADGYFFDFSIPAGLDPSCGRYYIEAIADFLFAPQPYSIRLDPLP
jgi:hypothetical protein